MILQVVQRLYEVEDKARSLQDDDATGDAASGGSAHLGAIAAGVGSPVDQAVAQVGAGGGRELRTPTNGGRYCRYTKDGRLTIDNNVSERRLRDQAIQPQELDVLGK